MRGYPLSEQEKEYIDAHPEKFASTLANELSDLYPEDNGGTRGKCCINKYIGSNEHYNRVSNQKIQMKV